MMSQVTNQTRPDLNHEGMRAALLIRSMIGPFRAQELELRA